MTATVCAPLVDEYLVHPDPINHIAFSDDGDVIATADTAMRVRIWRDRLLAGELDVRSISDKVRPTERVRCVRFANGSRNLVLAAGEHVWCYNLAGLNIEPEWSYVAPRLFAFLIVSPTSVALAGPHVVGAFDNGTLVFWDSRGEPVWRVRHNGVPRYVATLPDGSILGTDAFHWSQWRFGERRPLWQRRSHERIYGMAVSDDGALIALRHLYTTTVHRLDSGEQIGEHKQARGLPLLAFAPRSHTLAIGSQHGIELVGEVTQSMALPDAELISLAFQPDGTKVAAGCSDGRVRLWDVGGASGPTH